MSSIPPELGSKVVTSEIQLTQSVGGYDLYSIFYIGNDGELINQIGMNGQIYKRTPDHFIMQTTDASIRRPDMPTGRLKTTDGRLIKIVS